MKARALVFLLVAASIGPTWADIYKVMNNKNGGDGSLRRAIMQANSHAGPDRIIFHSSLKGEGILLQTQLPALTDDGTTINGDIDADGAPDIGLNGRIAPGASGLVVQGDDCIIAGLAIRECYGHGILIENARGCKVRSCHIGLNLAGTQAKHNQDHQLVLRGAKECRIGGPTTASRNVISGGYNLDPAPEAYYGILVENSADNTIAGNYIGVNRRGTAVLGEGECGIYLITWPPPTAAEGADGAQAVECAGNTIGGTRRVDRNVIAGVYYGVQLHYARENTILGNTFGLAADGNTPLSMDFVGVEMLPGSVRNTVGGTVTGARNVFTGAQTGVSIRGSGTRNNRVRGNYFGTNVAGNRQRTLWRGVLIGIDAEGQSVGGGTASAGNYFALKSTLPNTCGVWLEKAGAGTAVRHNQFGVRPDGTLSPACDYGIHVDSVPIEVTDNEIVRAGVGIFCKNTPRPMRAFRNKIRRCDKGVYVDPTARCLLGNLGNTSSEDDGGNVFRSTSWLIINLSPWRVLAEGSDFGTTSRYQIDQKIHDRRDNAALGRVDFDPLMGNVSPTGTTGVLAVSGATAVPTATGAQITFTLSSEAQVGVRVLNIAGRPVRTLCQAQECGAGPNALVWNAQADNGLRVANGTYLVEVTAKARDGSQASALGRLTIGG